MEKMLKKILFISYHYPPSAAIGGMRIYGNSKYLARLGWAIYILTVKNKHIQEFDYERSNDDRRIKIHRVTELPKVSKELLNIIKAIKMGKKRNEDGKRKDPERKNFDYLPIQNNKKVIKRIKNIIDSFLLLPDEKRNWIIPAALRAASVMKKNNIKIIYTTAPPFSSHLIGLLLKDLFDIKWIVDFRDPWVKPFNKLLYPTCKMSLAIENLLENLVIQKSDLVVTTTPRLNKEYKKIFIHEKGDKLFYLANGYDADFFNEIMLKRERTYTISYTGTLYFGRSPEPVLKAIKLIKKEKKDRKLKLRLIGNCEFTNGVKTVDLINKYGLKDEVTIEAPVNYQKSIEILKKSHLSLVLAPNQKYQIPAKIYDSIGAKTKVLAITGEGATKDLVNEYNIGQCFESEDITGIKEFIIKEMENREAVNRTRKIDVGVFEQKNITESLSEKIQKKFLIKKAQ